MCLHQCWTSTFQHYVEEDVRTEVPVYHQISVPVHLVSMDQIAVRVRKLRKTSRRTYIVTHCKQVTAVLTLKLACFQGCVKVIARMVECVPMATHAFVLKIHMERDASFVSHYGFLYVPSFHPKWLLIKLVQKWHSCFEFNTDFLIAINREKRVRYVLFMFCCWQSMIVIGHWVHLDLFYCARCKYFLHQF